MKVVNFAFIRWFYWNRHLFIRGSILQYKLEPEEELKINFVKISKILKRTFLLKASRSSYILYNQFFDTNTPLYPEELFRLR